MIRFPHRYQRMSVLMMYPPHLRPPCFVIHIQSITRHHLCDSSKGEYPKLCAAAIEAPPPVEDLPPLPVVDGVSWLVLLRNGLTRTSSLLPASSLAPSIMLPIDSVFLMNSLPPTSPSIILFIVASGFPSCQQRPRTNHRTHRQWPWKNQGGRHSRRRYQISK